MKNFITLGIGLTIALFILGCQPGDTSSAQNSEVDEFLDAYVDTFLPLYVASAEAEWLANTRIIPGDTAISAQLERANNALAAFTGNAFNIRKAKEFLSQSGGLSETQKRIFTDILHRAGNNPATMKDVVAQRITAENRQNEKLYGFTYKVDSMEVTTGQ